MKNFFNKGNNENKELTLSDLSLDSNSKTLGNTTTVDFEKKLSINSGSDNIISLDLLFKESSKSKNNRFFAEKNNKLKWALNLKILPVSILTILCLSGAVFSSFSGAYRKAKDAQTSSYLLSLNSSLINIEKSSLSLKNSPIRSFTTIATEKENINKVLNVLKNGGKVKDEIEISGSNQIEDFIKKWESTTKSVDELLNNKDSILKSKELISLLNEQSVKILTNTTKLQNILLNKERNSDFLIEFNSSVYRIINEIMNSENKNLTEGDKQYIYVSLANIKTTLNLLKEHYANSSDVLSSIEIFESSFFKHLDKNQVVSDISTLNLSNNLTRDIITNIQDNNIILHDAINRFDKNKNSESGNILAVLLGLLGIFGLVIISFILYAKTIKAGQLAENFKNNQSNEKALLELIGQIQPLDDGDFTKPIFVEDKFLSNISDRIDRTRVQFGKVVRNIKETAEKVLASASNTEQTSQELSNISNLQFKKLELSIGNISDITNSMDEIAQVAWIAQEESAKSFEESGKGEQLVKQSIYKMNEIREAIQQSSKKIKKLGESAQSISEVTSLIQDITKQINILALNAAIQAAASGDSGREFTIVAQEVQRLADDSEEATKKIEDLINDIQSDTAVAIASMEKTTQEVVLGSQLTEKAGVALQEIHALSKNTSEQIKEASTKLEEKSADMAMLTIAMQDLQKISEESQATIGVSSQQVEYLKTLSGQLEESVNHFRV